MSELFRREWGAVTFVATVLIGALAVSISLIVTGGSHTAAVAPPPPCPTFTPYVTSAPPTGPSAGVITSPSAQATLASPTPFDAALANCPTAPLPPTSTPGASRAPSTPGGTTPHAGSSSPAGSGSAAPTPSSPPTLKPNPTPVG